MDLGRFGEARADLEAVLASAELFPGTSADALVELGELARRERDPARAIDYLDAAARSLDVEDYTLVEALIVRAKLRADEGDEAGANNIWQSVLSSPDATARQRSLAETHLVFPGPHAGR